MRQLAELFHWNISAQYLNIILPIGLSFHTFQSLSYVIEVYKGNQTPERNFGIYSLYVMFYPQLVAGPIERPQNLLHQFHEKKTFEWENIEFGFMLICKGMFKKVVLADRLAPIVNAVYDNPNSFPGSVLALSTLFFSLQIYFDFSGYSDIALGSARVMGFHLMSNFNRPYFSSGISEFWKRWHISLSTWFKDYVYIPLGGNRKSNLRNYGNLLVTFLISGLWHGANWTFVCWGAINAFYLILESLLKESLGGFKLLKIFGTFLLISFSWVFFRATSIPDAFLIIKKTFTDLVLLNDFKLNLSGLQISRGELNRDMALIGLLFLFYFLDSKHRFMYYIYHQSKLRLIYCWLLIVLSVYLGRYSAPKSFIYFQF